MAASLSEVLAAAILVLGLGKAGWDFFLSPKLLADDEKRIDRNSSSADNLRAKIAAAASKRSRDGLANQIMFATTTALSAWLLVIGFSTRDISTDEFDALEAQVVSLGAKLSGLETRFAKE